MNELLIIVDYQYDFVANDGLLTAGEKAQNIENNIYTLANEYIKNNNNDFTHWSNFKNTIGGFC